MNQITISMNKQNDVSLNNRIPSTMTTKKMVEFLRYTEFVMIRFEFDNLCYSSASDELKNREYNKYVNRINKLANELGLTVELIDNKIVNDITFPNHFVAVVIK